MTELREKTKPGAARRRFLKTGLAAGAISVAGGIMARGLPLFGDEDEWHERDESITRGDAALLRFAAAAEILESDFWQQYNELGGIQDDEVPGGTGNSAYTAALEVTGQ